MRISVQRLILCVFAVTAMAAMLGVSPTASASPPLVRAGSDDIRVWIDEAWDVYPSYDDVVLSIRAERSCYATVFVVDTDGYVHVVYPFSPRHSAWVRAGVTYRYTAHELGLDALYGAGVAYVFAVGSRDPFDYSYYGDDIFVGHYGYRVWGDPYVACRNLYVSLLPPRCDWDFVWVSSARFYVRSWVRYPSYLCRPDGGVHIRVGSYCRSCAHIYDGYRVHVADPYPVISARPSKFKSRARNAAVEKTSRVRKRTVERPHSSRVVQRERASVSRRPGSRALAKSRVVSTDRTVRAGRQVHWNDRGRETTSRRPIKRPRASQSRKRVYSAKHKRLGRTKESGATRRIEPNRSGTTRPKASQPRDSSKKRRTSRKAR